MMGSGGMIVMDEDTCMVDVARYFLGFLLARVLRQVPPCREGLAMLLHDLLETSPQETATRTIDPPRGAGPNDARRSLCGLGHRAQPRPVHAALLPGRVRRPHADNRCPAGVCKALIRFEIDEEPAPAVPCAASCPRTRSPVRRSSRTRIDQELCTTCGVCRDVCKRDAVLVQ